MKLRETLGEQDVLVVMDFTDEQVNQDHHQDLIITLITKKASEPPPPKKKIHKNVPPSRPKPSNHIQYLHFVGEARIKNDFSFVLHIFHNHLVDRLRRFKKIDFFTDGGPKHFKISAIMNMLHHYSQHQLQQQTITYHFYASYHGHGICDAAASHAKSAIWESIGETKRTPKTSQEICTIIDKINNHISFPIPTTTNITQKFKTMVGIRSFHKFQFTPSSIVAYLSSSDTKEAKTFLPEQLHFFSSPPQL